MNLILPLDAFQELLTHLRTCPEDECAICDSIEGLMAELKSEEIRDLDS